MRRHAAVLAVFLLVAPAFAGFVTSLRDAEAARCALACARAGMGMENGASCCPMGHGAVPSFASCARDGDPAPIPAAIGPMLLLTALLLPLPSLSRRLSAAAGLRIPFPPARLPDKVPLLLG